MPFFSRSKRSQVLAASDSQQTALHRPPTQQKKSESIVNNVHEQDPRKRRPLQAQLKEIRLLCLQPGKGSDPLCCKLQHTSILSKRHLKYETVSYCWGKNPGKSSIRIDGTNVSVTKSAVEVLQRVRDPRRVRTIWIDAICIDQNDDNEKSAQVGIMADIYRRGSSNFIWLGEVLDAQQTLRTLRAVLRNIDRSTKGPADFRSLMAGPPGAVIHDGNYLSRDLDWGALRRLYDQPWFQRLWVAQEAALAPVSVCNFGDCSMSLTEILNVAVWLIYNVLCLPRDLNEGVGVYAARAIWYIIDEKDTNTDLFGAFIMAQNFKAKDPRDHVYALRSLYRDRQPQLELGKTLLRPNYDKNRSKHDVFRDATLASILDCKHLGILQFVDPLNNPEGWPSWTLQFDIKTNLDKDPICRAGNDFSADNNTDQYPPQFLAPYTLVAYGIKVDVVAEVSPRFSKARSWATGEHSQLMNKVGQMIKKRRGHTDWVAELATTLVAGGIRTEDRTDLNDFVAFLEYSQRNFGRPLVPESGKRYDERNLRASRWFNAFELTMYGRRFFMANLGFPGVGPLGMQNTDVVMILCGGSVPFVLRPSRARKDEYSLVGVCYVFGVMHGEAAFERNVKRVHIV